MTARIHRYVVPVDDAWHEITLTGPVVRRLRVFGTGQELPAPDGVREPQHVGSAVAPGGLVWHLIEMWPPEPVAGEPAPQRWVSGLEGAELPAGWQHGMPPIVHTFPAWEDPAATVIRYVEEQLGHALTEHHREFVRAAYRDWSPSTALKREVAGVLRALRQRSVL